MIKSLQITNHLLDSILIDLRNPAQSGFFIRGVDGLGPVKSVINRSENPYDGSTFNSARVTSRNIVLSLGFYDGTEESIETIRQKSYVYFPIKKKIEILVKTDNRELVTNGHVESNEPDIFSNKEGTVISVLCEDSYFKSKEAEIVNFAVDTGLFEFPFENPSLTERLIEFGLAFARDIRTIFYSGEVETGVIFSVEFTGNVPNLSIFNSSSEEQMNIDDVILFDILGSGFISGDQLFISTITGSKFAYLIRDGVEINILNALDLDGDWINLFLRNNTIYFTADSGMEYIKMSVIYYNLYQGV